MIRSIFIALTLFVAATLPAIWLSGFHTTVLNPKGIIALQEYNLLVNATLLMLLIVIPVLILTFAIAWRYRAKAYATYRPDWDYNGWIELLWWGVPFIIIIILSIMTWRSSHSLDPFKELTGENKPLKIQVVALRWKWLFIYPEYHIATINYLQFPKNRPIHFEITADAPMNSFWIPALGGQIYAMPGMKTQLSLMADGEGVYQGASANLSGYGFSGMKFTASSLTDSNFEEWALLLKNSSNLLTMEKYKELLRPTEYDNEASYALHREGLFDWIVMKYMMPEEEMGDECMHRNQSKE
ncbi:MAG: ubiquinol oxidase subunit II [Chlamydia sp.]